MATFLDVGLLKFFLPIFTFLFILALLYGLLQKLKWLSDNKDYNLFVALTISLVVLFSGKTIDLINFLLPWFVIIIVFLVLLFMTVMPFGIKEEEVWARLGGHNTVVIILLLLITIGIGTTFGSIFDPFKSAEEGGKTIGGEIIKTIYHPRMLGALLILIVSAFAIQRISESFKEEKSS